MGIKSKATAAGGGADAEVPTSKEGSTRLSYSQMETTLSVLARGLAPPAVEKLCLRAAKEPIGERRSQSRYDGVVRTTPDVLALGFENEHLTLVTRILFVRGEKRREAALPCTTFWSRPRPSGRWWRLLVRRCDGGRACYSTRSRNAVGF